MVINLYYTDSDLLSVHGFGYLLPQSLPFEQNPERALGVIFDSDATLNQDGVAGTKLTVMIGGHWWNGWTSYPDEEQGLQMAKSIVARHLNIRVPPQASQASLQRNCIPQYTVGHYERMGLGHRALLNAFHGRLRVAGNSYTGVGLNDCVRSAFDVTMGLLGKQDSTGLDRFDKPEFWVTKGLNE